MHSANASQFVVVGSSLSLLILRRDLQLFHVAEVLAQRTAMGCATSKEENSGATEQQGSPRASDKASSKSLSSVTSSARKRKTYLAPDDSLDHYNALTKSASTEDESGSETSSITLLNSGRRPSAQELGVPSAMRSSLLRQSRKASRSPSVMLVDEDEIFTAKADEADATGRDGILHTEPTGSTGAGDDGEPQPHPFGFPSAPEVGDGSAAAADADSNSESACEAVSH